MKKNKIGFGVILVIIGVLWLLVNLEFIDYSIFYALKKLWPLILIALGIQIVTNNNKYVKIAVWIIFVIIFIVYGYYDKNGIYNFWHLNIL